MAEKRGLRDISGIRILLLVSHVPSQHDLKPGPLWEFGLQLSLGSPAEARPGRQGTVYKQLGIERPPAAQALPAPPLTSPLFRIPRLHSQVRWQDQQDAHLQYQEVHCPQLRASGGTVHAKCVESSGWIVSPGSKEIWIPILLSSLTVHDLDQLRYLPEHLSHGS